MKKRILSLLLVVVMLTLTLASCAYSYAKDDMSQYTKEFNFDALKNALMSGEIKVVDGDYTTDSKINDEKTVETIYKDLARLVDADKKMTEGAVALYDVLYYAYYITASFDVKEGEETVTKDVILHSSFMKEASATSVQLGVEPTDSLSATKPLMTKELAAAITEAIKDKDIKDFIYITNATEGAKLELNAEIYVSYTSEKGDKKTTVTYEKITLGDDDFSAKIMSECKTVGNKANFELGEGDDKVSYKNVVVECIINDDDHKLGEFKITDYDDSVSLSDVYGTSYELKNAKDGITVHVYPVYFLETPDFDAKTILDLVYGANIKTESLKVFSDESYKTADGKKLADLITELATVCKDRDTAETKLTEAEKAYDTAKKAVDDAGGSDKATALQNEKLETATKDKTEAETKLDEAKKKVEDKIAEILAIEGVADKIIEESRDNVSDNLKYTYDEEMYYKVAAEVWKLVEKYITVSSRPEKAVKEAEKNILETYKSTFYTGTKSEKEGSYYKVYAGDFKAYLIDTLAKGKTYDDALAVIHEEAVEHVDTMIRVYTLADAYNCKLVTDKDYENAYTALPIANPYYEIYLYYYGIETNQWLTYAEAINSYGEDNVHATIQFNKVMHTILAFEESAEGDASGYIVPFDKIADYISFGEGDAAELVIPFKNIRYTTTEETTEDTEG
ncbi:MAG: hypothetical protein IKA67_02940 [Clostridia bacterium]|nr:hypothetical protein [Clostridia bacterium]